MKALLRPKSLLVILSLAVLLSGGSWLWLHRAGAAENAQFPPPVTDIPLAIDKGYGVSVDLSAYDEATLVHKLAEMQNARLTWLRLPIRWADIEVNRGEFDWRTTDQMIAAATLRGFNLILTLETAPQWATHSNMPQTPPQEVQDFGNFARQVAMRYGDQVDYYQIWDEPNLSAQWGGRFVDPAAYALLLKNGAINIRAVDSQAKILTAALAPTTENGPLNLNEIDFLHNVYQSDGGENFDIVAAQALGFHLGITPVEARSDLLNIHRVTALREVMVTHGDAAKPVWATSFGWNALPADWVGDSPTMPVDVPKKQLERTEAALTYMRANWAWLGPVLGARWDADTLAGTNPERGLALFPTFVEPIRAAAKKAAQVATLGSYPASHPSGQYSPGWTFGLYRSDSPKLSGLRPKLAIPFEGTRLDLIVDRGDYQGYLWVSVDGAPANALPQNSMGQAYVVLSDPLQNRATVTLAENLSDGPHVAEIEVTGSWGQWPIAGWQVYRLANTKGQQQWAAFSAAVLVLSLLLLTITLNVQRAWLFSLLQRWWVGWHTRWQRIPLVWQYGAGAALLIGIFTLPGLFALPLLGLLGLVFLFNLEIGLAAISVSLSFFLAQKSFPLLGTRGIFELIVGLQVIAFGGRLLLPGAGGAIALPRVWRKFRLTGTDWGVLALLGLALLSTVTAINRGVSLYEFRVLVLEGSIFYALLRLYPLIDTPKRGYTQRLVDALITGGVLHATAALGQYLLLPNETINAEGVRRAIGFWYGSPNNLTLFLERLFPILLAIVLFGRQGWRRALYGLGLAITSVALFLTFSKGALLLAVPAVLLFFALMRGGRVAWLAGGVGLILLAIALIPLSRTTRFRSLFSLQPGSTTYSRLNLWQSAWQMLQEHPWTGLGLDNFLYQYRTRYILPQAWEEPDLSHPHNLILDFGTRLGVGGIAVIGWLQWRFWRQALTGYFADRNAPISILRLGLMGSMITFLAHGLVDNAFFLVDLAFIFFFSLGIIENLQEHN